MRKTIRVAFATLALFMLTCSVHAESISLNIKNKTLKEAILIINKQTGYHFVFEVKDLNTKERVSISANDEPIEKIIQEILKNQEVSYEIKGKNIIIIKNKASQNVSLSGNVQDNNGEALIGVTILNKSNNQGVITDADGNFNLSDVAIGSELQFSYIGYSTVKYMVKNSTPIHIKMHVAERMIEEVVVIGYGSQKKENITSSISSLKREDFLQGSINSPMDLVKGKVAGLNIINVNGSDPTKANGGVQMMLRGVSNLTGNQQPLVVVDGIAGASLTAISPDDIESIDVLKDGSAAAIYGTRGNNGVVIVTTKKGAGNKNGSITVDYHGYATYETIANQIDVLSAKKFLKLPEITGGQALKAVTDNKANTAWFDQIYHTPVNQNHTVSIRMGNSLSNLIVTANYINQDGILKNSEKDQLRMRMAANQSLWNGKLRFYTSLVGTMVNSNYVNPSIYYNTLLVNPTSPIKDSTTGKYIFFQDANNPVQEQNEKTTNTKWNNFAINGKVTYAPINGLNISAVGGIERFNHSEGAFATYNYFNGDIKNGEAWRNCKFDELKTLELLGDYDLTISNNHTLNALVGYSFQQHDWEGFNLYNFDFPTELLSYNALHLGLGQKDGESSMGGYKAMSRLISSFARLNYAYKDLYMASLSIRREGSSKFGANHKWGTFPALSLGWNIRNESFMESAKWLDNLKLRVGYGVTGAEPSSPYLSINSYSYSTPTLSSGSWVWSVGPNRNPNRDLRWEKKKEINFGVDYSLFRRRVSGSIDLYDRRTDDLIYTYQVPVPPNLVPNIYANVGSLSNKGIEILLNGILVKQKYYQWNISTNFSINENKLLKLSNEMYQRDELEMGNTGAPIQKATHIVREGDPIGQFYGWKSASISEDGKQWLDAEGNPLTMENDKRTVLGNGIPKFFYGLSFNFIYKNLDATVSLRGAGGFQILNQYRMLHETFQEGGNQNYPTTILDKPYGVNAYTYTAPSYVSYYIENGDYLKLENVTIGYNIKFHKYIDKMRVYISGDNLYTFTKYKGVTPEVNMMGLTPGVDNISSLYPSTRIFSVGIQISLLEF